MQIQYFATDTSKLSDSSKIKQRAILVSLLGITNSGKSTLINRLLQKKISIVTPKKQTTRENIRGILNIDNCQIVLTDTPGLFEYNSKNSLEKYIRSNTVKAVQKTDCICVMISIIEILEATKNDTVKKIADRYNEYNFEPKILVFSMWDILEDIRTTNPKRCKNIEDAITYILKNIKGVVKNFRTSIFDEKSPNKMREILDFFVNTSIEKPWLFKGDIDTNLSKEKFCQEITREKIYTLLKHELPYETKVETELFVEKESEIKIYQTIHVKKASQQKIIIGKNGDNLKKIGISAREEIEGILKMQIHLFIHVKVSKDWIKKINNKIKLREESEKPKQGKFLKRYGDKYGYSQGKSNKSESSKADFNKSEFNKSAFNKSEFSKSKSNKPRFNKQKFDKSEFNKSKSNKSTFNRQTSNKYN